MFRPQIQKTYILFIIAIFNLSLVYIASHSYEYIEKEGLEEKIRASNIMANCESFLKKLNDSNNIGLG